jgi:hypothetical protein
MLALSGAGAERGVGCRVVAESVDRPAAPSAGGQGQVAW